METVAAKKKFMPKASIRKNQNGKANSCKVICFNIEKVKEVKKSLPTEREFEELVGLYAALGNITRLKIIFSLAKGELCVCDIANVLGLSIPATSHQLKYLYEMKILNSRNDGKMVYYKLNSVDLISVLKDDVKLIEEIFIINS